MGDLVYTGLTFSIVCLSWESGMCRLGWGGGGEGWVWVWGGERLVERKPVVCCRLWTEENAMCSFCRVFILSDYSTIARW